jgi:hypothetical protein
MKECGPFAEDLPQIGAPFVFTMAAQTKGYKPQVIKNPIAHHYRIFAMDFNDYERFTESAMSTIPRLMREIQSNV